MNADALGSSFQRDKKEADSILSRLHRELGVDCKSCARTVNLDGSNMNLFVNAPLPEYDKLQKKFVEMLSSIKPEISENEESVSFRSADAIAFLDQHIDILENSAS